MADENRKLVEVRVGTPSLRKYSNSAKEYIAYDQDNERISVKGSVASIVGELQAIQKKYCKTYRNLMIRGVRDCGCRSDCDCGPTYYLFGTRYEIDLEYDLRTREEELKKRETEERERQTYEQLKKKFDKPE